MGRLLEGFNLTANQAAFWAGQWLLGPPIWDADDPQHRVYALFRLEFYLAMGWLVVGVGLTPLMLIFTLAGDWWKGNIGNQTGLDIATAIVGVAFSGYLVHLVHLLSLRYYWLRASGFRSLRPNPSTPIPPPSRTARRFLASTPADVPIQISLALVLLLVLLLVNP